MKEVSGGGEERRRGCKEGDRTEINEEQQRADTVSVADCKVRINQCSSFNIPT